MARGGEWQWCSACRHYEHMQAWVPDWWTCKLEFDESILTAVPNVLDMLYQNPQKVNKWKRISQEDLERWNLVFSELSSRIQVEGKCPICNEQQLYHYYALQRNEPVKFKKRWYKGQGAYWQWCSACYHYQYRHWVYVPMEWEESMVIEAEELMVIPESLNEAVKSIM
ncbi:MAG: hypothetical protein IJ379_06980 [Lachnospiraceae bacterium]|nr:hypothetical protein [Lachnospiraceae bacterium]